MNTRTAALAAAFLSLACLPLAANPLVQDPVSLIGDETLLIDEVILESEKVSSDIDAADFLHRPPTTSSPTPAFAFLTPPDRSRRGGKTVCFFENEPVKPINVSVEGGFQSRYYFLGLNQILNAAANLETEDTQMWYTGASANLWGFGLGVKYIRSFEEMQTINSVPDFLHPDGIDNLVFDNYEEWVFDANYSLDLLPDQFLNATVGYQALYFPEETFWNTDRQDHMYVSLKNSTLQWLRPSATYHYLTQGDPLTDPRQTVATGSRVLEGEVLTLQVDGFIPISNVVRLPVDLVYYVQVGFDNGYNQREDFDHDYTQVGLAFPITVPQLNGLVITPNWNFNDRPDGGAAFPGVNEHFWGINARLTF